MKREEEPKDLASLLVATDSPEPSDGRKPASRGRMDVICISSDEEKKDDAINISSGA